MATIPYIPAGLQTIGGAIADFAASTFMVPPLLPGLAGASGGLGVLGGAAISGQTILEGGGILITGVAANEILKGIIQAASGNSNPGSGHFADEGEKENYYKEGLQEVPDDWIEVEAPEELPVKSKSFIEFLRENGFNPKKWVKVVENGLRLMEQFIKEITGQTEQTIFIMVKVLKYFIPIDLMVKQ